MLQAGFHFFPLGGVKHQRQLDVCYQPRSELMHILFAVAAHEVDVHVQDMCTLALLFLSQSNQAIPVFGVQQIAHLL